MATAQDILSSAREYLVQNAKNFKCEDVLSADVSSQPAKLQKT